jgi:hypothetical protein
MTTETEAIRGVDMITEEAAEMPAPATEVTGMVIKIEGF